MPRTRKRTCATPRCPAIIEAGRSYCARCQAERDAARGGPRQRGYDASHDAERARWSAILQLRPVPCARCRRLIYHGEKWDLGHDETRTKWTGPEHPRCNRAAAGRAAHGA